MRDSDDIVDKLAEMNVIINEDLLCPNHMKIHRRTTFTGN